MQPDFIYCTFFIFNDKPRKNPGVIYERDVSLSLLSTDFFAVNYTHIQKISSVQPLSKDKTGTKKDLSWDLSPG